MKLKARVEIRLKPGLTDAEGLATLESLRDLGFNVLDVKVGKIFYMVLEAPNLEEARQQVDVMCKRLLANPEVKDDYTYTVEPEEG
ncbi:MAG: phosphoribosylformylglycinamidine synthase, purS protein [Thermoprotei archaeon]|nr:MAG: phosphoribosylformylglycinamidine synthase, purS protein [Thermoprotei archaeon]